MARKLLAVATVLALTASLFSGCSGGTKQDTGTDGTKAPAPSSTNTAAPTPNFGDTGGLKLPIVDKPTTLTWMIVSDNPNLNNSMVAKEIEKRTGIKVDFQAYSSATYQDKLKVVLASGQLPDIVHGIPAQQLNKMGGQGALAPITQYVGQLPNFKKLYVDDKDNAAVVKSFTDDKNNLYAWPIYGLQRDVNHGFLFRKDIFDKASIKEWTNMDEFYQALKKLKEAYPQSYPYASKTKEVIFRDWSYGWGFAGISQFYDEKDKTWKYAATQPGFKDMLDFMKKLYNEGLIDPEFITDTDASWTAKMTTDKAFVTFDWIGRLEQFANAVKGTNPNYNLRYGNPVGPTNHVRSLPKIDNYGIAVSNGKNKEIALKLLDYLTSPSGADLVTLGIEGETFKWDNNKPVYPELKDVPNVDIKALENKYGMWVEGMYLRPNKKSVYFNFTEKEQEAQDKIKKNNLFEVMDPSPKFSDEETKTIADIRPSLEKAANEFFTKYVIKKEYGDKEWQEWLQTAEKLGASKMIAAYNSAQKRFDAQ